MEKKTLFTMPAFYAAVFGIIAFLALGYFNISALGFLSFNISGLSLLMHQTEAPQLIKIGFENHGLVYFCAVIPLACLLMIAACATGNKKLERMANLVYLGGVVFYIIFFMFFYMNTDEMNLSEDGDFSLLGKQFIKFGPGMGLWLSLGAAVVGLLGDLVIKSGPRGPSAGAGSEFYQNPAAGISKSETDPFA